MKELKVYNNKSIIKYLFIFTDIIGFIAFLVGSAVTNEWLVFGGCFIFVFLMSFIVFINWYKTTMSYFIFNKDGLYYYSNKKEKLSLRWGQITEISHNQLSLTDLPETRCSPCFLTIIYKVDNKILCFTKPFPLKEVDKLSEANFNPVLNMLKR